jgi:hypothetical protein
MRDVQNFAILTVSAMERKNAGQILARPLAEQRVFVIRERASLPGADDAYNDQPLIFPEFEPRWYENSQHKT